MFNRRFLFEVRPRPAADWLSDVSWARLSEMEDLGKGPWPGRIHWFRVQKFFGAKARFKWQENPWQFHV